MNFLVLQHLNVEHPGIFRAFWKAAGISWTAVELDEGEHIPADLSQFDAMVVMGGPMDVWQKDQHSWLVPEIAAIRTFAGEMRRPFLGVCLGHQLLAEALGGSVSLAKASEVGVCAVELTSSAASDPLLGGLPSPLTTFQWHSAEVRSLPKDSVVLARTDLCEVQAFRYQDRAYGLQFHAEITSETVDDWRSIPAYEQSLEATLGVGSSARLATETLALLPSFNRTAKALSDNFLKIVKQHAPRPRIHASRQR